MEKRPKSKPLFKQYLEIKGTLPDNMFSPGWSGYPSVKLIRNVPNGTVQQIILRVDNNKKVNEIVDFFNDTEYQCSVELGHETKRVKPIKIQYSKDGTTYNFSYKLSKLENGYLIAIRGETEEEMFDLTKLVQTELTKLGVKYEKKCRWVCFT